MLFFPREEFSYEYPDPGIPVLLAPPDPAAAADPDPDGAAGHLCPGTDHPFSGHRLFGGLLIQSGVVRIYLLSEDGREATISRMTAGEVCVLSASCMLSAITFDVQIQAEGTVETLVIPIQYLAALMRENIYVENFIYKAAAERFSHAIRAIEQMLFYTLEQRVASYLLEESKRLGSDTIQVTQEQLAQAIGSAREAVTRTLKKLSAAGTVELFRGGVRIQDGKGLERLVKRGSL